MRDRACQHRARTSIGPGAASGSGLHQVLPDRVMLFIVFDIEIVLLPATIRWVNARAGRERYSCSRCSYLRVAPRGPTWIEGAGLKNAAWRSWLSTEKAGGYVRKNSLWPATLDWRAVVIEVMATAGPRFDIARFGMERSATPRQADLG